MTVRPVQDQGPALDLMAVVEEARDRGLTFPLLLRFQDLLRHRVQVLNEEFRAAIAEAGYQGAVPRRLPDQGEPAARGGGGDHGRRRALQVRPRGRQQAGALRRAGHPSRPECLLICNGYKDTLYIQMALLGRKLGKTIIMVVEKVEELKAIIDVSQQLGVRAA